MPQVGESGTEEQCTMTIDTFRTFSAIRAGEVPESGTARKLLHSLTEIRFVSTARRDGVK
jgi:hypothetical protein